MKKVIALLLVLLFAVAVTACGKAPLALDQTELSMTVGDSAELSAGDAVKVNWTSSDDKIATVIGGTVNAKSAGTAIITAALENGETATCTVTVADKLITGISLSASSVRVEVGKTIQLSASYTPADASSHKLSWESSDEDIVTVDPDGYVTAVAQGEAKIICKSENGIEASCAVTVGGIVEMPTSAATLPPATEKPSETPTESKPKENESKTDDSEDKPAAPSGSFIFPDSSSRYLSQDEIAFTLSSLSGSPVSDSFAQDAVNEILARNGYIFRTPEIRAYYEAQSWYHADPSYDGSLNAAEMYNIGLLSNY